MTTAIVLLIVFIVVPTVVAVYRNQRRSGHLVPQPIGDFVGRAVRDRAHPYGPDSDRIVDELTVLTRDNRF